MIPYFTMEAAATDGDGRRRRAFTLVEIMVAVVILVLLLAIIAAATQNTVMAIHRASGKLSTFATARAAFDTLNEKLSQATLNTYIDYYDSGGNLQTNAASFAPAMYGRVSNLQFLVRQDSNPSIGFNVAGTAGNVGYGQEVYFQCPAAYSGHSSYQSTQGLLNACGYYVQYCNNDSFRPLLVKSSKWRYRLIQAVEPTENFQVYVDGISDNPAWTKDIANTGLAAALAKDAVPLADNVIAMVVHPQLPAGQDPTGVLLAPKYLYDSQLKASPTLVSGIGSQPMTAHQLPPILTVTLVVIDEASAARIDTKSATPPGIIEDALRGKFNDARLYAADLADLEKSLGDNHLGFEVFSTSIVLRESKWSQ